ncbi:MAG: transcriptional regulator [Pseudomonadota bacterium]
MQTSTAKRIEIMIEAVMERRLTRALREAGATGYTVLPVLGGSGASGDWSRDGQISRASGMVSVVCVCDPAKLDTLLQAAFDVVEPHIGVVSVGTVDVVRTDRF